MTGNSSSNYPMTREQESTLDASSMLWPGIGNDVPRMAHVIQQALGVFKSSLEQKPRTKSWEAHERNQQFGENKSTDIG